MSNGRILIVSDRQEVVAELEPIVRAGEHLALAVPDGDEALRLMAEGVVPDLMISDLGSPRALEQIAHVWRFRELNRVGRHMVVVEDDAPCRDLYPGVSGARPDEVTPLRRPFRAHEVRQLIGTAVRTMDRELRDLRGEMFRQLQRMQQELRDVQRETVTALAATIAARDPYMHGHATRVASLAGRVAAAMELPPADRDLLDTACRLHEIGKSTVPVELLHKTEPLRPDELARIREHARIGATIVGEVPTLRPAAPIIAHQGTDYRDLARHLDPEGTPFLLAAILRAADAYDAMTSPRSYRGPMPRSYWEDHLRTEAGGRYHPQVVEVLLQQVGARQTARAA